MSELCRMECEGKMISACAWFKLIINRLFKLAEIFQNLLPNSHFQISTPYAEQHQPQVKDQHSCICLIDDFIIPDLFPEFFQADRNIGLRSLFYPLPFFRYPLSLHKSNTIHFPMNLTLFPMLPHGKYPLNESHKFFVLIRLPSGYAFIFKQQMNTSKHQIKR